MKRKTITEQIQTISPYDLDMDIDQIKNKLDGIAAKNKSYTRIWLDWANGYAGETGEFIVYGVREENAVEFAKRKLENKKAKESAKKSAITRKKKQEEEDKAEYERLKKKYK